jgi:hypothetical protein
MLDKNYVVIILERKYYFGRIAETEMIEWVTYSRSQKRTNKNWTY